jgi:RNA polymerase sigma factor (sigma-70 family)
MHDIYLAAKNGDKASFQEVFIQNENILKAIARRYSSKIGYDDAYQEAFILFYQAIRSWNPSVLDFKKYLYYFLSKKMNRVVRTYTLVKKSNSTAESSGWRKTFQNLTMEEKIKISGFTKSKIKMIEEESSTYTEILENTLGDEQHEEYSSYCERVFNKAFQKTEIKDTLVHLYTLKAQGFSFSEIADLLSVSKPTVAAKVKKYEGLLLQTLDMV